MSDYAKLRFTKPALRILENEHRYLSYLMEEWHQGVLHYESREMGTEESRPLAAGLRRQISEFRTVLKKHTDKEETHFFPLLGSYIGFEQGPLVGIQEEHREIDDYFGHFFHHMEGEPDSLSPSEIQKAVRYAGEAFEVLTVHLLKEETVLFPMAETQLKAADQDRLADKLNTLIT